MKHVQKVVDRIVDKILQSLLGDDPLGYDMDDDYQTWF